MISDLFERKKTHFIIWRPGVTNPAPQLSIGLPSQPVSAYSSFPLIQDATFPELWSIPASACGLSEGAVYYYGFAVALSEPFGQVDQSFLITDPAAYSVDRSINPPIGLPALSVSPSGDPLSIIAYIGGELKECDNGGSAGPLLPDWTDEPQLTSLPQNDSLVIYEMPTRWAHTDSVGNTVYGSGTFQDVLALLDKDALSPTFPNSSILNNRALIQELGVNAIELLPCSDQDRSLLWGYGMANFLAADYDLGKPPGQPLSTASTDLVNLVKSCHKSALRVFLDIAMSWCENHPYVYINFTDFFPADDTDPEWDHRNGWGGQVPKFNYAVQGYDPISGTQQTIVPARQLLKLFILRWLNDFHIDGLRLDDIANFIPAWDSLPYFVEEITQFARQIWTDRGGADAQFLSVGEELSVPPDVSRIVSHALDGQWNDTFRAIIRPALLGQNWPGNPNFEQCINGLIDPRTFGFTDTSQIVNYLGSHDTGNFQGQRIYNWFLDNNVADAEPRIKLGFACLLTAIGIPMILAGDEFADQMDPPPPGVTFDNYKQEDPVNWSLLGDVWRQRIFAVVANLVKLRTTSLALSGMEITWLHANFDDGQRVMAWLRGSGSEIVITVANFSDWSTTAAYQIDNWPRLPVGYKWFEVTLGQDAASAGNEPIEAWQGKVFTLVEE